MERPGEILSDTSSETGVHTPPRKSAGLLRSLVEMVGIVALVVIARTALASPFYIPSASMEPTLLIGDEIATSNFAYGYSLASLPLGQAPQSQQRLFFQPPTRGDIVVFRSPARPSETWVKRVIGLPGDRVAVSHGRIVLNGEVLPWKLEGRAVSEDDNGNETPAARFIETLPGGRSHAILKSVANGALDNEAEITVPADHLFVLGDNRDNSADSRVPQEEGGVGLLPVGNLVGRVDLILGSWDLATRHKPLKDWASGLRGGRFFSSVK